jgi:hypothetical protein
LSPLKNYKFERLRDTHRPGFDYSKIVQRDNSRRINLASMLLFPQSMRQTGAPP